MGQLSLVLKLDIILHNWNFSRGRAWVGERFVNQSRSSGPPSHKQKRISSPSVSNTCAVRTSFRLVVLINPVKCECSQQANWPLPTPYHMK